MTKVPGVPRDLTTVGRVAEAVDILSHVGDVHTEAQHLARARLWVEFRDDPSLNLSQLSPHQLAAIAREPRLPGWLDRDPTLRGWFTSPREMEERVEALFGQFLEGLEWRRREMGDKDYIQAMKLLAEVGNKMPQKWAKERILDETVARMTEKQQVQSLIDALQSRGYNVEAPASANQIDAAPQESPK